MTRNLNISLQPLEFGNFTGINNVDPAIRLKPNELSSALNVDLDNEGFATRRDGVVNKVPLSGSVHSLWSDERICLYVDDGVLKRLFPDYSVSTLRSSVSNYAMSYASAPNSPDKTEDTIYYTNTNVIGYINAQGENKLFADPGIQFRSAPEPAQHIEYYNMRLYLGDNQTLWYTDAGALGRINKRFNNIPLDDEITMIKAVDDGIWVSTGDKYGKIFFLSGNTPQSFTRIDKARYGIIQGSPVKINDASSIFPEIGISGKAVIFATKHGVCIGGNGGRFINLTYNKYKLTDNRFGAGLLREIDNKVHYITTTWS